MMAKSQANPLRQWTDKEKAQLRESVERWKWLGPVLDGIRFRELRAMTDDERIQDLTGIQALQFRRTSDDGSGWIAWQKVRKQWMKRKKSRTH